MSPYLEHANLAVLDLDATTRFLRTAFPHFVVRGEGRTADRPWRHVGDATTYVALEGAREGDSRELYGPRAGLNHLAFVVENVNEVRERLQGGGYVETTPANDHPHRTRVYFVGPEGMDWEFVQYRSSRDSERNDYAL